MLLEGFFALLWFFATAITIVGLIRPSLVVRWGEYEDRNRKAVLKFYGTSSILFFTLFLIFLKPINDNDPIESNEIILTENNFELSDSDIEILSSKYIDLSQEQISRLNLIINNFNDMSENDKSKIQDDLDSLKKQKQEKYDDDIRILAEKEAHNAELKAKYEKEKYNTGITRNDIARDKSGLIGSYVKFNGKIIQVMQGTGYTQYRMAVNNDYDQIILIEILDHKLDSNILENDVITIEGESVGNITYDTIMGGAMTIPGVSVDNIYY